MEMHIQSQTALGTCGVFVALVLTISCAGSGTSTPPPPPKSPVPTPTVLRSLYRFLSNGTDRVTTFGPNERATYPLEAQVYYVPDQLNNSRVTLNRVVNAGGSDHGDSTPSLSGYTQDLVLGNP